MLRNDLAAGQDWLRVKLVGPGSNFAALGGTIRLHAGGITQTRTVGPAHGYLSQSELPVTFGLGLTDKIERLEITWPDGTQQSVAAPQANALHSISQAAPAETGAAPSNP